MNLLSPLTIFFAILTFAVQFFLCCKTRKTLLRLIPAMAFAAGFVVCIIVYLTAAGMGTSLVAVVDMVLLAILLAVDGAAWLVYCIARFIQNVR